MAWSLQGAEKMANMRVAKANGESISKQYLEVKTPTPIVVEIKDVIHKELKRLKQIKILGKDITIIFRFSAVVVIQQ